jgi:SAM-dependent methyltransferase
VARLVALADVSSGDLVLDVGAGRGAITAELLRAGAHVIAVELHEQRVTFLRERFDGQRVTVVRTDASDLRLPRRPFKVVANPPFGATNSTAATTDLAVEPTRAGQHRHAGVGRHAVGRRQGNGWSAVASGVRLRARPPRPAIGVPPASSERAAHPARGPASTVSLNPDVPGPPARLLILSG